VNLTGGSGNLSVSGTGPAAVWTMNVNGDDIQGTADRGYFVYTTLPGDGAITARILSQTGGRSDGWMKTGVMIRENDTPSAAMATINQATGQNGTETLFRLEQDGDASKNQAGIFGHGVPQWLRAQRQGQKYQLLLSDDGQQWQVIKEQNLSIDAGKPVLVGLDGSTAAGGGFLPGTATFDNLSISSDVIAPPPPLGPVEVIPGSGAVLLTYGTAANAVGYNIYRRQATETADKAVLLKAEASPYSTPYSWFIDDNQGKGLPNGTGFVYQVKAVLQDASGKLSEGSTSSPVLAEPQLPILGGLTSYDIGTQTPGSTTLDNNGMLTISGSGNEIQGINDQFRFVTTPKSGDYTITAKILDRPSQGPGNTQTWIKAGVMIRESLDPGARMADVLLTQGNGILMEDRRGYRMNPEIVGDSAAFGSTNPVADADVKVPLWLRITRTGDTLQGSYSTDGTTFTAIDPPNGTIPNLSPFTYAGLCVTAHQEGTLATARFDAASIKIQ
jgi:regulation of enolase protein 1 (concanavalin A-like superfamily)